MMLVVSLVFFFNSTATTEMYQYCHTPCLTDAHPIYLLITRNSYRHRLFNGDIGICLRGEDGAILAWFPGDTPDIPRVFHPAALPQHDSAFAMTVHKAQSSEFDEVWLLLPAHDSRVLSRELVYTGITRARRELMLRGLPRGSMMHWRGIRDAGRGWGGGWLRRKPWPDRKTVGMGQ